MSYRLYYAEPSAAMGIRVLLEELGADYELVPTDIDMATPRAAEFLALNPNGWVPVLAWDGGSMYEAAAITVFLCDRHPGPLAPGVADPERGPFLQWLVYFSSSVQNAFQMTYYPFRFCNDESEYPVVASRGVRRLRETFGVVDDALAGREWLLGAHMSAADIYLFMLSTWLRPEVKGHPPVSEFPEIHRVCRRVAKRPTVREVYADRLRDNPVYD